MEPDAFLFDLDGTLVDSERDNVESVVRAARGRGIELDGADRRFIVGHSWNEVHAHLVRRHALGLSMDELVARAIEEKRALQASGGVKALPGAVAAVLRCGRRAPLAVVSGSSRIEVEEALGGLGLRAHFRFLLTSEDYGRGKPDPAPYRLAIARLGVAADRCIVLEDAQPGVLSARGAGARVVGVSAGNFVGYDLSAADAVVDTLDDVTEALCDRLLSSGIR